MQVLSPKIALGIYSDSSATGVSVSLLKTDGLDILATPITLTRPYSIELKKQLLAIKNEDCSSLELVKPIHEKITQEHITAAQELLNDNIRKIPHVDIGGYSGHLLHLHQADRMDITLGSGKELVRALQIPIVDRFTFTDLQAGGTGGPLLTTFMEVVMRDQKKPIGIISLGGITSLLYIGPLGEQYAFEVGVGALLIDKWLQKHTDVEMDYNGDWAEKGKVDTRLLEYLLKTPYLRQSPPKTLDRDDFDHLLEHVEGCSPADGAATLTAFVVESIIKSILFLPSIPNHWILTGGGTFNPTLVLAIKRALKDRVQTFSELNLPHYNLEATGYAFLAVRHLAGLPITFPETTGVKNPITGGIYHNIKD